MAKLKNNSKARFKTAPRPGPAANQDRLQDKAEHLSRSIMESAQQIWLAGIGAFGRAQQEGTKMFEALVSEGAHIEKNTRKIATGGVDAVRDAVESRVGQVKGRATDTWDRLEKVFEDRVQGALTRLGVPGRDDLQALIARVDELNGELRKLSSRPGGERTVAPTPARPAVRKAPVRKPVSPKGAVSSKPASATKATARKAPVKRTAPIAAAQPKPGSDNA